ncbi:hypothetical protein KAR91_78430 [Candidatus Pacearchaeota archaeon]|nr:hypothetical protein [Candidatus Pacearchaeota archaeon]
MKCPKCNHIFKAEGQKRGGEKSKRKISPEAQAKMQAARNKPEADIEQKEG